jgi:putative redox protein
MSTLRLTYDGGQHGTALKEPQNKSVAIDCPYTGKGEELSPGNLVGIGVAGCMLLSMGALAQRDNLDLRGTVVDIELTETNKPFPHIDSITLAFDVPRNFSPTDRQKLERAAALCPISASFRPETTITATFKYSDEAASVA